MGSQDGLEEILGEKMRFHSHASAGRWITRHKNSIRGASTSACRLSKVVQLQHGSPLKHAALHLLIGAVIIDARLKMK